MLTIEVGKISKKKKKKIRTKKSSKNLNRILVEYLKKLNNINRSATVYKTNFSENFFKYNIETSTEIAVEKKTT